MSDQDRDADARESDAGRPPEPAAAPKRRARRPRAAARPAPSGISRLSDAQRAALARMTEALATELAAALTERLDAVPAPAIAARLDQAGVLRDPELTALLLRRTAEYRLVIRRDPYTPPLLPTLAHDADHEIATAARALIAAEARRHDRFDDPILPAADLPAELHHRLVWTTAAAIRAELAGSANHDRAIAAAATAALARYDEAMTFDSRAAALVRALDTTARLDDAFLAACAWRGPPALVATALATRAEMAAQGAWEMLLDPAGDRFARLLRAAEVAPATSERILIATHPEADAAALVTAAQSPDPAADDALHLWRLDPAYRAAILALDRG